MKKDIKVDTPAPAAAAPAAEEPKAPVIEEQAPVEPVQADVVPAESKDVKKQSAAYDKMIEALLKKQRDLEERSLLFFWLIGEQVEVLNTSSKYGDRTVDTFAKDIGRGRSQI